ncbi:hypothetical protein V6U81_10645 [Micromonospora sp. CPCC 205711]|uniref:hypothetical protein n=1 Tax=Micromonospora sp. CPCC 205547 TaxID=3122400 RepID=UPI002FF414EF
METWRFLAAVLMSLTLSLVGVGLAANFRGVTQWHVRRSMSVASVLRRIPPWRWLPDARYDQRLARFVLLERAIGVAFAAVGIMFLILLGYGVLSGEPMPSSR